jgi:hypothetical protein
MKNIDQNYNSDSLPSPESSRTSSGLAPFKLLMLSGGSLVGQNVLSALAMRRDSCQLSVMNCKDDEPAIFDYDTVFFAPSLVTARKDFEQRFGEVLSIVNPDLIIPCRDEDVVFVSELAEKRPDLHARLLCGSLDIAVSMLDKWLSWEFSNAHGLPFAPSICTNMDISSIRAFIERYGLPIIAKPRTGFASRGVKLLFKRSQLDALFGRPDYILQKYIGDPGKVYEYISQVEEEGIPLFHSLEETKISVQGCIGPKGELGGFLVTQHVMRQGKSERVELCEDDVVLQQSFQWIAKIVAAGWRGPINIQCQRDQDGNLSIYEYNGRFTGATSGRILLGFDEVGITLGLWLGKQFPQSGIRTGNKAVVRTPVSRVVDLLKVNQIRQKGYWRE